MTNEIIIKIMLSLVAISFIIVIVVKRFVYFRPGKYSEIPTENYTDIRHGNLHGWLLQNPQATRIVLFCKDRTGNITHCQDKIIAIRDLGYNVLAFDYSGYGKSQGIPNEQQLYDDASIMTSLVRQEYSPEQIILYGDGVIGTSVALHASIKYSIPTVIIDSPLTSINVLAKRFLGYAQILAFPFTEFNIEPLLRVYRGKTLMFNSDNTVLQSKATTYIDTVDPPWDDIKKFVDL